MIAVERHEPKGKAMFTKNDITEIKKIRERSAKTLNESANVLAIVKDCALLSSGTLATLTGARDYETLDAIHSEFITYVRTIAPKRQWKTWVDAWKEYAPKGGFAVQCQP